MHWVCLIRILLDPDKPGQSIKGTAVSPQALRPEISRVPTRSNRGSLAAKPRSLCTRVYPVEIDKLVVILITGTRLLMLSA